MRALQVSAFMNFQKNMRTVLPLPFYASTGCASQILTFGACGTVIALPGFDLHEWLTVIGKEKGQILSVAPSLCLALLAADTSKYDLSSVTQVLSTGAAASPEMLQTLKKKLNLQAAYSMYGMTETLGRIFRTAPVPICWPHAQIRIVDDKGETVPIGVAGEIQVIGPSLCSGYLNDPEITAKAFTADGWLKTGDVGHFDNEWVLQITGRIKDLIIRGGTNIWPAGSVTL